jgi:2-octaprenyl-6-methoxyphenol hydroxylase
MTRQAAGASLRRKNKERGELAADVAVVGGGLNGLSLAAALGSAGVATIVIDQEDPKTAIGAAFDGRAFAIAFSSMRLLKACGVWRHLEASQPILDIRVSDGDSLLFLHYDHRDVGPEPMGQMVESRHLRLALYARLAELDAVRLLAPARLAAADWRGERAKLRLADGTLIKAELCVAADGARSKLREQAAIGSIGWSYHQAGIVCTVAHELAHQGVAHERFLPAGPFAILPLTGNRSSLVWTESATFAPKLLQLPEDEFLAELRQRFGEHLGALALTGPRWSYPLSLHLAERYSDGRLVLVGDAAHVIHPIAGQGLNLGLRDVAALAEIVVDAKRLGLDCADPLALSRYQRWRRLDCLMLAAVTDSLNRLFSNGLAPVKLMRDLGLGLVNEFPPLKRFFMRHAMGVVGDLPKLLKGQPL